jgi:hypothetical protein
VEAVIMGEAEGYTDLGELGFYHIEPFEMKNVKYKADLILFVCAPNEQLFPCHTQADITQRNFLAIFILPASVLSSHRNKTELTT